MTEITLAIEGGICVLPSKNNPNELILEETTIGIHDGKIVAIGDGIAKQAKTVLKAKGLHVIPGAIDAQVHFREPGATHKEDLATGTMAAILGGVTSICEMPNTKPPTTTAIDFQDKLERAKNRTWCNYGFFIGATPENIDRLKELELLPHCCGVKVFMGSSTGTLLVSEDQDIARILQGGKRRVAFHAEDENRLNERKSLLEKNPNVSMHPVWRDELTALLATKRLIKLGREAKRAVHVLHVTTAEEVEYLRSCSDVATWEIPPQHLTLSAPECYERLGTLAQMNPPIREKRHQDALWKAVQEGWVTSLASDHAPHTLEEKALPYPASPSGMPGVQTILPLMLHHANQGKLSLIRVVELLCRNPARIYKAKNKGALQVGHDADITLIDMNALHVISNKWIASRCGWTPFDGMKINGWPIATIVGGNVVMRNDQVLGSPRGQGIDFDL